MKLSGEHVKKFCVILVLIMFVPMSFTGCASIIKGGSQEIPIVSKPSQADVKIYDENEMLIAQGKTPFTANLKKKKGFFKGKQYKIVIEKANYKKELLLLEPATDNWYCFGNLLCGGLIGYLIVDPATGAMWRLKPEEVSITLSPETSSNSDYKNWIVQVEMPK